MVRVLGVSVRPVWRSTKRPRGIEGTVHIPGEGGGGEGLDYDSEFDKFCAWISLCYGTKKLDNPGRDSLSVPLEPSFVASASGDWCN